MQCRNRSLSLQNTSLSHFLDEGLELILLWPKSKRPIPHPQNHSWWRINLSDLNDLLSKYPQANFALICKDIVQVDFDNDNAISWGKDKNLDLANAWILRTGRGWRFLYRAPENCPLTFKDPAHAIPDLLGAGSLALIPPSIHPNGRPYQWVKNHSPFEISFSNLDPLPEAVLTAWRELKQPLKSSPILNQNNGDAPAWLGLVFSAVYNELERRGHKMHQTTNGGFVTTCPFHDDHNPSFSLHPLKGWHCFAGCGEGRLTTLAARLGVTVGESR